MRIGVVVARALGVLGLAMALAVGGAKAQSAEQPPVLSVIDANGVNLATGKLSLPGLDVSLPGLSRQSQSYLAGGSVRDVDNFSDFWTISVEYVGLNNLGQIKYIDVSYDGDISRYQLASGMVGGNMYYFPSPYSPTGKGGIFTCTATPQQVETRVGNCTLQVKDGTLVNYVNGKLSSINKPDGEVITEITVDANSSARISSLGWAIKKTYTSGTLSSVAGFNTSVTPCVVGNCTPPADAIVSTQTISGGTTSFFHNGAATGIYTIGGDTVTMTSPRGVVKTVILYPTTDTARAGMVWKVQSGGAWWTYSPSGANSTITAPNGTTRTVSTNGKVVTNIIDEAGRNTQYYYDSSTGQRLIKVVDPDGNANTGGFKYWVYDSADRITNVYVVPKNSTTSGTYAIAAAMVTSLTYNSCTANTGYCRKPTTVTDPNGIVTTYTYDATVGIRNGLLLSQSRAAVNGVTSQTVYMYGLQTPKAKDGTGTLVNQPQVPRLIQTSTCMSSNWTGSACAGGATDEARSTITYGTNNILPVSTTTSRGDGSGAQTSQVTYDDYGRTLVVDGPKPGPVDEVYTIYDSQGRQRGVVGMDPDGTGVRHRQGKAIYFDEDWHVREIDTGIVGTGTSGTGYSGSTPLARRAQAETDLNAMTWISSLVQERDTNVFDIYGRPTIARHFISNSTTPKDVTQRSYDSMQRVDCEVVRTNSTDYGTVASLNACNLGTTNTDGTKDRITKYAYNLLGQVVSTTSGYGTGLARLDSVSTYDVASSMSTGNLNYIEDAKGNRTTFYYDGFNRLIKTCYPNAANGQTSSTTDCEQIGYRTIPIVGSMGAGTLVHNVKLRDFSSDPTKFITFGYDKLGRVFSKSDAVQETFTYNNFDQVLTHVNYTTGGAVASEAYSYNALGQLLSDAQAMGTVTYEYDGYGKRSKMTYPGGGLFVTYAYNDGDELTGILENGASAPVFFGYDDYGRRWALGRNSGYYTGYYFDASLRLQGMTNYGASGDNTITLGYSPTDQINSRTQTNPAYDPPVPGVSTTAYGVNGLNQMTQAGSSSLAYDLRGNMTSDGAVTYGYNANNLLTSVSAPHAATLVYDAENRLQSYTAASTATRQFLYDGVDLIAEYDASGNLLRRYVHGPGDDEPLVWYEGSGTSTRRFFVADERGSIVAVTDSAGVNMVMNTYNEYGVPTATGSVPSRFGYTGQVWLPEISMAYYKARMYAPTLGRFLQTDPIGYGDGMNWYAYVGNDPMNGTDPSGLKKEGYDAIISCELDPVCSAYKKSHDASREDNKDLGTVVNVLGNRDDLWKKSDARIDNNQNYIFNEQNASLFGLGQINIGPRSENNQGNTVTAPAPAKIQPKEKTDTACGIFDDGSMGCKSLNYKELCAGASKRRKALTGLVAADAALVGGSGFVKQFAKGAFARLVAAEITADVIDELKYCE